MIQGPVTLANGGGDRGEGGDGGRGGERGGTCGTGGIGGGGGMRAGWPLDGFLAVTEHAVGLRRGHRSGGDSQLGTDHVLRSPLEYFAP
eukprot:5119460-Prymnesium_polylepis.1